MQFVRHVIDYLLANMFTISKKQFEFKDLIVFEMANNHQGSVEHGLRIIRECGAIAREFGIRAAVKLQFRDIDTFIHPEAARYSDNKHVPRFLSTRLTQQEFKTLVDEIHTQGLVSMCTPFDEISVDRIDELGIQVMKVGSCSAQDWPLLAKVADSGKPVICSTAGLPLSDVDKIASFFEHRGVDFALMHCVALYPTPIDKLRLHRIEMMRYRYPKITIGFSTHEDPENADIVRMAYAKGARIFEKHVGVATDTISLNKYSASPEQLRKWLGSYQEARAACNPENADIVEDAERTSLQELSRGVYLKTSAGRGATITKDDVYFAMPRKPGQMSSGQWPSKLMIGRESIVLDRDYHADEALPEFLAQDTLTKQYMVYNIIHEIKAMLNQAGISVGYDFSSELSHHYGVERFREFGAFIITSINREYCKKIIVMLPGQEHPMHYHQQKEETFQLLSGELDVYIDDRVRRLMPGDTLLTPRGVFHGFKTTSGAIFEEISTTHIKDDSFYADKKVAELPLEARKTRLIHWGYGQLTGK